MNVSGALIVKDLVDGSAADQCNQIKAGDILLQVTATATIPASKASN